MTVYDVYHTEVETGNPVAYSGTSEGPTLGPRRCGEGSGWAWRAREAHDACELPKSPVVVSIPVRDMAGCCGSKGDHLQAIIGLMPTPFDPMRL